MAITIKHAGCPQAAKGGYLAYWPDITRKDIATMKEIEGWAAMLKGIHVPVACPNCGAKLFDGGFRFAVSTG